MSAFSDNAAPSGSKSEAVEVTGIKRTRQAAKNELADTSRGANERASSGKEVNNVKKSRESEKPSASKAGKSKGKTAKTAKISKNVKVKSVTKHVKTTIKENDARSARGRTRSRRSTRIASCSPHPSGFSAAPLDSLGGAKKKKRHKKGGHRWSSGKRSRSRSQARQLPAAGPVNRCEEDSGQPRAVLPITTDTGVDFRDVGGLDENIRKLKEMIVFPIKYPKVFARFGCPRGVLFYGPPGTGKTLVARALVKELSKGAQKVTFYSKCGSEILSKWFGESESNLRAIFDAAKATQPSVIFFDELDALAPARSSQQDHVYTTIVGTLLTLLDGLEDRQQVVVIGATNRPDALDGALRRPGRFDRELFFPPPNLKARREILRIRAVEGGPDLHSWLAERTAGFCGADMRGLIHEAFLYAVKETYPSVYNTAVDANVDPNVKILKRHYEAALASFRPSGGRGMGQWRETVPEVLHSLIDADRRHLVSAITERCPWLVSERGTRGEVCSTVRVLLCPDERYPEDAEYAAKSVLASFRDCNICAMNDAYVMSLSGVDVMQMLTERIHDVGQHQSPTVLYMPRLEELEQALQTCVGAGVDRLLGMLPRWAPLLVLLTSVRPHSALDEHHQAALANAYVHKVARPCQQQRQAFFAGLLSHGRGLSERNMDQLALLTRGWSVQDLGQLSVRVSQIRSESNHTPSVTNLIKELSNERQMTNRRS